MMKRKVIEAELHSLLILQTIVFEFFKSIQREKTFTSYGHNFGKYQVRPLPSASDSVYSIILFCLTKFWPKNGTQ